MRASNALPIQFFHASEPTFNEAVVIGNVVEKFYQPFQNNDEIIVQVTADDTLNVDMDIKEDGVILQTVTLTKTGNKHELTFTALTYTIENKHIVFQLRKKSIIIGFEDAFYVGSWLNRGASGISWTYDVPLAFALVTLASGDTVSKPYASSLTYANDTFSATMQVNVQSNNAATAFQNLNDWTNNGSGLIGWNLATNQVTLTAFETSQSLAGTITPVIDGTVLNLTIDFIKSGNVLISVGFLDVSNNPVGGSVNITFLDNQPFNITIPANAFRIGISCAEAGGGAATVTISSVTINSEVKAAKCDIRLVTLDLSFAVVDNVLLGSTVAEGDYLFEVTGFKPSPSANFVGFRADKLVGTDIDVQVNSFLVNNNSITEYRSDEICFKEYHRGTRLIKYSDRNKFAGIDYTLTPVFALRLLSKFFDFRFPDEMETEEVSNSTIDVLSNNSKTQKLLEVEPCPSYMHKKVQLILHHNSVSIDNVYWVKEEGYSLEDLDKRHPFKIGKVWLTEKLNQFETNVYAPLVPIVDTRVFDNTFDSSFE